MARTKEQLLIERERIKVNMEKTKERRLKRLEEIDKLLEELDNKRWKPKYSERYFTICADGQVELDRNTGTVYDEVAFSIGNYFKTEEEAEFEVERLKVLEELKEFSYEFSDEDWKDNDIVKFSMYYDYDYSKISIRNNTAWKYDSIYYKTEEDVQKAIYKIGEERLKKYYFKAGNNNG